MVPGSVGNWIAVKAVQQSNLNKEQNERNQQDENNNQPQILKSPASRVTRAS
jgi:hypothetical protein